MKMSCVKFGIGPLLFLIIVNSSFSQTSENKSEDFHLQSLTQEQPQLMFQGRHKPNFYELLAKAAAAGNDEGEDRDDHVFMKKRDNLNWNLQTQGVGDDDEWDQQRQKEILHHYLHWLHHNQAEQRPVLMSSNDNFYVAGRPKKALSALSRFCPFWSSSSSSSSTSSSGGHQHHQPNLTEAEFLRMTHNGYFYRPHSMRLRWGK